MNNLKQNVKNAFTIMEVGLSLLIVSILVIVCIPIVTNQAKKTDEYAYYLAFKTVEKMGSQIVVFGDPQTAADATSYINNKKLKDYIANYTDKLFKFANPVANAAIQTSEIVSFPEYEYDYVRLCLGNKYVSKNFGDISAGTYNDAEIAAIQAEPLCQNTFSKNNFIGKRFMCSNMSVSSVRDMLSDTDFSLEDYCYWLAWQCEGAYDCSEPNKKNCYVKHRENDAEYRQCIITVNDPDLNYSVQAPMPVFEGFSESTAKCDSLGYVNMVKNTDNECICDNTHPIKALNNNNVCCETPPSGLQPYYAGPDKPCFYCGQGKFNEVQKKCCPAYSVYSSALGKCVCIDGYTPNDPDNLKSCTRSADSCPVGTHLNNNSCVSNKPVTSAKRLCELIAYHWNVSTYNCDTFSHTGSNDADYYHSLYDAITANSTPYLSAIAVKGAFNEITPNIVFANGLRLWILGDKSASIAGLSFNPDGYTPNVNTCKVKSAAQSACATAPDYFCKTDNLCFTINKGNFANDAQKLEDARNCCSITDFSDINIKYQADYIRESRVFAISGFTVFVDINGTKDNDSLGGGGTLWKDVFPFFIGTNGKVYPAYPLNAAKASGSAKDNTALYQGGNSSALSADVYYYDIVDGKRKKIVAYPSIPYARALCFATEVSAYTPYCLNLGSKYKNSRADVDNFIRGDSNPCFKHKCTVKLKNKIKYL